MKNSLPKKSLECVVSDVSTGHWTVGCIVMHKTFVGSRKKLTRNVLKIDL